MKIQTPTQRKIVRQIIVDDGSTCGKRVLIDNYGKKWIERKGSIESRGTNEIVVSIDKHGNIFNTING